MHLIIILTSLITAWLIRRTATSISTSTDIRERLCQTLLKFLFPPLLIFTTFIALLCMGPQGRMGIWQTGCLSYAFAVTSLVFFSFLFVKLAYNGWQYIHSISACPQAEVGNQTVKILDTQALFAGQIGFWKSELVISKGLLESLSFPHLETVLAHEQGHYHYHDTFWFFWLGWIRECTAWLPNTKILWEELLILRELRADAYAASRVDNLLLAESLLFVVSRQAPLEIAKVKGEVFCAALGSSSHGTRLEQRIEALLNQTQFDAQPTQFSSRYWYLFLFALLPMMTVLFHQ